MATYHIIIATNPVPAPRQSRKDRFNPSRRVQRYHEFRDMVILFARNQGIKGELKTPVAFSFVFGLVGNWGIDLDNTIKGIKDALVRGGHLPDDTYKQVSAYRDPVEIVCLCDHCHRRLKKRKGGYHNDCGAVRKCKRGFAYVKIEEEVELSDTTKALANAAIKGLNLSQALRDVMKKEDDNVGAKVENDGNID